MLDSEHKSRAILKPRNIVTGRLFTVFIVAIVSIGTISIWLHNRDIIRDLFDYSIVISAPGKVEAGLKPYTGVRSPMQSSVYLFNYATERLWGSNYLALTWGGLVQALGGAWILLALLWKRLGAIAAVSMAMAVTLAGLLQHVIFFYNPLGIFCFSIVVLGLALEPQLVPWRSWNAVIILSALFIGGMNKLNYQGAALLLGGLIVLAAWSDRRIKLDEFLRIAALMALCGLVLPIGFELIWTGASLGQWIDHVVLMPTARQVHPGQLLDADLYLRPIFDYHHHILVRPIGGVGVILLVLMGIWMGWKAWKDRRPWWDWTLRFILLLAGWVMCALLMLTNHESVLLTSLAFPVFAMALYLIYRSGQPKRDRLIVHVVIGASLLWSVVGGYATWHGSRVLYALDPPPRSSYVKVEETTGPMSYFAGVRFLPEQLDAYRRVIARLDEMASARGHSRGILFGPLYEWMERYYPPAITKHEPIWYDAGTTLSESDLDYFRKLLDGGSSRLVTSRDWQAWPNVIQDYLDTNYRAEHISSRDIIYHPRGRDAPNPTVTGNLTVPMSEFRAVTGSNVMLRATRVSANFALESGDTSTVFGTRTDSTWEWPRGVNSFQGKAVARLDPQATGIHQIVFRIMSNDPLDGKLLWEMPVTLTPERARVEVPFTLHAHGKPVWLQTLINSNGHNATVAGWREIRITHAGAMDRLPALPFNRGLQLKSSGQSLETSSDKLWFEHDTTESGDESWHRVPAEHWRRYDQSVSYAEVAVEFEVSPQNPADPVVVALAWYRAGRFEIMTERMIDLRQEPRIVLKAYFPEPTGWVGVLTRPAGGVGAGHRVNIIKWEIH